MPLEFERKQKGNSCFLEFNFRMMGKQHIQLSTKKKRVLVFRTWGSAVGAIVSVSSVSNYVFAGAALQLGLCVH